MGRTWAGETVTRIPPGDLNLRRETVTLEEFCIDEDKNWA